MLSSTTATFVYQQKKNTKKHVLLIDSNLQYINVHVQMIIH